MTLQEAITRINALKPHQYTTADLIGWLYDLDASLWEEFISAYENTAVTEAYDDDGELITDMPKPEAYSADDLPEGEAADESPVLIIPEPYTDVYMFYLSAQIDYWNREMTGYGNSMRMYNSKLDDFKGAYMLGHKRKAFTEYPVF